VAGEYAQIVLNFQELVYVSSVGLLQQRPQILQIGQEPRAVPDEPEQRTARPADPADEDPGSASARGAYLTYYHNLQNFFIIV